MEKSIDRNLLNDTASLRNVLSVLNQGVFGVVFIVDSNGVMKGLFTDGDVRRALLNGADLSDQVEQYMNTKYTAGSTELNHQENIQLLTDTIRHLPILDELGRPVDMISWAEFWRLPVMEPSLGGNELKYVSDCITSNWISSQGEYVTRFEKAFSDYLGVEFALTTTSGTTALHLALVALGIGFEDEVIVPDLTFAASANTILHCGGKAVFVDVDKDTWTLDPTKIEPKITERTKAIMPVHLYGHPCDMDPIMDIASKYNLLIVEDSAESLGSEYKGKKAGTIGDVGCFSFYANKVITTGEGGMVTTNDPELFERMQILRDHGMSNEKRYWHLYPGFNYRMTNLQAAIGLAQMERVNDFLEYRQQVVQRYNDQLSEVPGLILPPNAPWAKNIYWLYSIIVDKEMTGIDRENLVARLTDHGIETRPFFYPLHEQPPYSPDDGDDYPVTDWLSARGLSLPTSNDIHLDQVDKICEIIMQSVSDVRLINSRIGTPKSD